MARRRLADLPQELLEHILGRLSFFDLARSACVCRSWRSAFLSILNGPIHPAAMKLPWWVYSSQPNADCVSLCSPFSYELKLNLRLPPDSECFGHSLGWLAIYEPNQGYYVLDPLHKRRKRLPVPDPPQGMNDEGNFFRKAILCHTPYNYLLVVAEGVHGGLYFCWLPVNDDDYCEPWSELIEGFSGAFVYSGMTLYCINSHARHILTCYRLGILRVDNIAIMPQSCNDFAAVYLVVGISGELLLVERMLNYFSGDSKLETTIGFRVYKRTLRIYPPVGLELYAWEPVETLGDQALFVSAKGECCAKACPALNPLGLRRNCIYFSDIRSGKTVPDVTVPEKGRHSQYYDLGVFSLNDNSVSEWQSELCPLHIPFWFFPR